MRRALITIIDRIDVAISGLDMMRGRASTSCVIEHIDADTARTPFFHNSFLYSTAAGSPLRFLKFRHRQPLSRHHSRTHSLRLSPPPFTRYLRFVIILRYEWPPSPSRHTISLSVISLEESSRFSGMIHRPPRPQITRRLMAQLFSVLVITVDENGLHWSTRYRMNDEYFSYF